MHQVVSIYKMFHDICIDLSHLVSQVIFVCIVCTLILRAILCYKGIQVLHTVRCFSWHASLRIWWKSCYKNSITFQVTFLHFVGLCIIYTFVLLRIIYTFALKSEEDCSANIATHCGLLVLQIFWFCNGLFGGGSEHCVQWRHICLSPVCFFMSCLYMHLS